MYTQERKAGIFQYFLSLIVCLIIWVLSDLTGAVIDILWVSDLIFIVFSIIAVYLIYTHYCPVFVYDIKNKNIIFTKKIGAREVIKETVSFSKIDSISKNKPINLPKDLIKMKVRMFGKKRDSYLIYNKGTKCIVFEPDDKLYSILSDCILKNGENE